jgi:hypothetical protein
MLLSVYYCVLLQQLLLRALLSLTLRQLRAVSQLQLLLTLAMLATHNSSRLAHLRALATASHQRVTLLLLLKTAAVVIEARTPRVLLLLLLLLLLVVLLAAVVSLWERTQQHY